MKVEFVPEKIPLKVGQVRYDSQANIVMVVEYFDVNETQLERMEEDERITELINLGHEVDYGRPKINCYSIGVVPLKGKNIGKLQTYEEYREPDETIIEDYPFVAKATLNIKSAGVQEV